MSACRIPSLSLVVLIVLLFTSGVALGQEVAPGAALTAAFTYQGSLQASGAPGNGPYDFQCILYNAASEVAATVGGGTTNSAGGASATVSGGAWNTAGGSQSTVGGGFVNSASGMYATVGGGASNSASAEATTVGGGHQNSASGNAATVGGGSDNIASGLHATVAGGTTTPPAPTIASRLATAPRPTSGASSSGRIPTTSTSIRGTGARPA